MVEEAAPAGAEAFEVEDSEDLAAVFDFPASPEDSDDEGVEELSEPSLFPVFVPLAPRLPFDA